MTTDEMRKSSLDQFDFAVSQLRKVVCEDGLCNDMYRPLKDAKAEVEYAIGRILRVNGAIAECTDGPVK